MLWKPPADDILRIVLNIVSALEFCHDRDRVHRDIKPANILFDRDRDRVQVTDFGLARSTFDQSAYLSEKAVARGTAAYMSPRTSMGQGEGMLADVYAVGAVMYELLTGQAPYNGDSIEQILGQVKEGPPRPIREINTEAEPTFV